MNLILLKQSESIETLWNVNVIYWCHCSAVPRIESIETLWNVNICKGLGIHLQDIESIETLWNVNQDRDTVISIAASN